MKIEISCELCRDLMPLVRDDVAGEHSREAVAAHLENCAACREIYEAGVPESGGDQALHTAVKRVQTVSALVAGAAVLLGIFLSELVMQGSSAIFIMAVLVIGSLVRIGVDRNKSLLKKIAALVSAAALTAGILWLGNEVFGNPVTKSQAEAHIQGYLEGKWPEAGYYLADVDYVTSSMTYEGEIRSETDESVEFYVVWRRGEVLHDTYEEDVLDIWE